jgi:hypothetical protein
MRLGKSKSAANAFAIAWLAAILLLRRMAN